MTFPEPFFRWRPHPWHGLSTGPNPPSVVHAYIEATPDDPVKYEICKVTGYLRVDRPHRTSSLPPCLYGFIPRTYCGKRVGALAAGVTGGDHDPLDICVLSERPINRAEVLLDARVVGVVRMIDGGEADDKIIAVLANDEYWGHAKDLDDVPQILIHRLRHYFETYKLRQGGDPEVTISSIDGAAIAKQIIIAAHADYEEHFGE
jgi:inorganic pyrophosphatase